MELLQGSPPLSGIVIINKPPPLPSRKNAINRHGPCFSTQPGKRIPSATRQISSKKSSGQSPTLQNKTPTTKSTRRTPSRSVKKALLTTVPVRSTTEGPLKQPYSSATTIQITNTVTTVLYGRILRLLLNYEGVVARAAPP
jgi:hypothetical protein